MAELLPGRNRSYALGNPIGNPLQGHRVTLHPSRCSDEEFNRFTEKLETAFFQALGITTKISRGIIEILSDVQLIKTGDKVGASEATLLNMLNISPFSFGLIIQQVFDNGSIYNPEVLDITEETLHRRFLEGVRNVASVCLQIGYPTIASVPHSIINGSKRALAVATEYTFPLAEKVKAFLADPSAFVAAAPVAAEAAAPAKEEVKEESEESDEDMGFGLFD
ncbi:large ribosomal subunit protein uL10-like [Chrysemys picta bellii]|uniref:large ribosomal subunit protein uL10-like n=1 Tax=Chrysemys picta bellii TaxID=8478 RepID=UPI0032B2885F